MPGESRSRQGALAEFVDGLQASGRYCFDRQEAMAALGSSGPVLKKAVMRLAAKGRLIAPKRGFYVIVPIEYRSAGAPPPTWFIDDLMRKLGRAYYVGLLSAAGLHGAAHQQAQEFQIMTDIPVRPVLAGRARIRFLTKRCHQQTPTLEMKTPTGRILVSTPEATAVDLLRYAAAAGGLSNVATVLAELAERLDASLLAKAAADGAEIVFAQRLGYLLDQIGEGKRAAALAALIAERKPRSVALRPGRSTRGGPVDRRWGVIVNERIEVDL